MPPARVWVVWQGETVAEFTLKPTWKSEWIQVRLPAPLEEGGAARIEIRCQTWNPRESGYNRDNRDLGVLFKSLVVGEGG